MSARCGLVVALFTALVVSTAAHRGGLSSCASSPDHGTSKAVSPRTVVSVINMTSGTAVAGYSPGQQYTIRVFRQGKFMGLTLRPYRGTTRDTASGAGLLSASTNTQTSLNCASQITHMDGSDKSQAEVSDRQFGSQLLVRLRHDRDRFMCVETASSNPITCSAGCRATGQLQPRVLARFRSGRLWSLDTVPNGRKFPRLCKSVQNRLLLPLAHPPQL